MSTPCHLLEALSGHLGISWASLIFSHENLSILVKKYWYISLIEIIQNIPLLPLLFNFLCIFVPPSHLSRQIYARKFFQVILSMNHIFIVLIAFIKIFIIFETYWLFISQFSNLTIKLRFYQM